MLALIAALLLPAAGQARGKEVTALIEARCPAEDHQLPWTAPDDAIAKAREHLFRLGPVERRLRPGLDWNQQPAHSTRARNALASLTWLDALAIDYRKNGNTRSLRWARDFMLDWVRHQPKGGRRTAPAAWKSKIVGDRAATIGYLTRASQCSGILHRGQARVMLRSIHDHAAWLSHHRVRSNHDLFDSIGLFTLGREYKFLGHAGDWRRTARGRFAKTYLGRVIPDEGLWLEQSAGYQYLLTELLIQYLAIDPHHGRLDRLRDRMEQVGGLLIEPDHRIVQMGDSKLEQPSARYQQISEGQSGLFVLKHSGFAAIKEPGSYLSIDAGFHHKAHKHADELSFDLYDRGHRITADTGMYEKQAGDVRHFVTSARAHSTLTADARTFSRSSDAAYGSGIEASGEGDGWYAIEAKNPLIARQGVEHHRTYLYKPGVALILIDRVKSKEHHTYDRYFHFGTDLRVTRDKDALSLSADGLRGSLRTESTAEESVALFRGSPPELGWTSPGYRDFVPRDVADFRSGAKSATYVTTIGLDGTLTGAKAKSLGPRNLVLGLSGPDGPAGTLALERRRGELTVSRGG